jgi:pimeloyl-ACP methyl ester carboxylesterase
VERGALEPNRTLVLQSSYGLLTGRSFDPRFGLRPRVYVERIWGFHLRPAVGGWTRLVIRTRSRSGPRQGYALIQPSGLASLVQHSSLASVPQWVSEANRLRSELPAKVRETLLKHEVEGTTDDPAYEEAMMVFYRRHVCRADPWPECVTRAFGKLTEDPEVYHVMNGPSEFHVVGVIKDWDITDRLGEITVPMLITSGRYDEATPAIAETLQRGIAGSEWVVFEQSAHLAHAEEPQRYMAVLDAFVSRVEKTGSQVSPSRKPWFL